jgi:hypothetical protein
VSSVSRQFRYGPFGIGTYWWGLAYDIFDDPDFLLFVILCNLVKPCPCRDLVEQAVQP